VLGLALFLALLLAPAPEGLPIAAWRTAAAAALMATWWVTEAIPIPATSLAPLAVFPVLGIATIEQATTPYANPIIFLLLGGFLLALGMETWGLPRRMALRTIAALGHRPSAVIAGFMIAAAFLSMWVTNTATAMMMLPIGVSVIEFAQRGNDGNALGNERRSREIAHFATALMLGIAYACSIGGLATIVGTPPNAFAVGFLREAHGIDIAFAQWMLFALPVVVVGLAVAYLVLTRWAFPTGDLRIPGGREFIQARLAELGPMSRAERRVMVVFFLTAVLWIGRPLLSGLLPGLSDAGIAVGAGLVLFILPSGDTEAGRLLRWEKARSLPWGALLLFGGGLSLAAAFQRTGLTEWVGAGLGGLGAWPPILVVLAITTVGSPHGAGRLGRELRFHATGRNGPEHRGLWKRLGDDPADGPGGQRAQRLLHHPDHVGGLRDRRPSLRHLDAKRLAAVGKSPTRVRAISPPGSPHLPDWPSW
jgi:sodium-dependent dicarboxylate transporter 2/3/5